MTRRRLPLWIAGAYAVALGASTGWRWLHPPQWSPDPDEHTISVGAVTGDRVGAEPVRIAFRDTAADRSSDRLPVVLLHGSPGDNGEVSALAELLSADRRAIAPDLPGFGASSHAVPDYSFRAHAHYVLALLDSLRIRRAHLLGFSMGGGVAESMADLAPDRVASLTLLSAIGAQEYELLGDYTLNHAIHWLQLGGLWLLREGVPHFGAWDRSDLSVEYARNFSDSDQRPLRRILGRFENPTLIIQGDRDPLVEPLIAAEHHRIVPQSELVMMPGGNHFMAFARAPELAPVVAAFLARVDSGTALTRSRAPPDRIAAAAQPFDYRNLPRIQSLALVVLLLLIAAATLVSEDLACIATGLMVGRGTVGFLPGAVACLVGIFVGDIGLFLLGRWLGRPALRRAPLRWFLSEADVDRSAAWFRRQGAPLILLTRFVPGTRLPTYFTAGMLHLNPALFFGAFLVAAAAWTPLLVGVSAFFGGRILDGFSLYQRFALGAVFVAAFVLLLATKLVIPLFSWRGRRMLLSRWRRLTRWEYWPRSAFYLPIAVHVAWLAWKHRSLTIFSAVNPAIPGGGFVGESKAAILAGLPADPTRIPRWRLIADGPLDRRKVELREFMADRAVGFPIVLKPDIGERGGGVAIVADQAEADRYLERAGLPVIAQEYVPGIEVGLFYYREPDEAIGHLFAITEKRFPTVAGDGRRTLEELILADDRAVAMAKFFLAKHATSLGRVPAPGEVVPLVELGTHCRGSVFFDGEWMRTPALEAAVDELSRGYPGFWFGRYDVRSPSVEALGAGRFTVLELNGATAEATSIYDPENRLRDAYRVLRRQWSILFDIAAQNVKRGARPASLGELVALARRHRQALRAHVDL